MNANQKIKGYSANVRMELHVNGYVLPIGQLGPDFLILDDPTAHPPAGAEIHMWIDDDASRWTVRLPDGIDPKQTLTRTSRP